MRPTRVWLFPSLPWRPSRVRGRPLSSLLSARAMRPRSKTPLPRLPALENHSRYPAVAGLPSRRAGPRPTLARASNPHSFCLPGFVQPILSKVLAVAPSFPAVS